MVLLDLLGRRWTLRVMWELREGPLNFRALRARCDDVSPTLLSRRLAELRDAELLAPGDKGYALSAAGAKLVELLLPLHLWAESWARSLERN